MGVVVVPLGVAVAPGDAFVGADEDGVRFVDLAETVPASVGVFGALVADDDAVEVGQVELADRGDPGLPG